MRSVILSCAVAAAVVLAAGSPVLARGGGGGGGHGGGGGGHGGGGGGHFGGGGGRGPMMGGGGPMMGGGRAMMGGGSIRSNAIVARGGPRFSSMNLNRSNARFIHNGRFIRHDRFRFRRFRNAFFFGVGDGYYDYAYACPIVTVRYVRGGRVFYRNVQQCDYGYY